MSYLSKLKSKLETETPAYPVPFVGFVGEAGIGIQQPDGAFSIKEERNFKNQTYSQKKPPTDAGNLLENNAKTRVLAKPTKPTKGVSDDRAADLPAGARTETFDGPANKHRYAKNTELYAADNPEGWRRKFYNLNSALDPCPGFREREWWKVFDATHAFLEHHALAAHALGWTGIDLFAVHDAVGVANVSVCGALMVGGGATVASVERDMICFERSGRPAGRYSRTPPSPIAKLVWEFVR